MLGLDEGGVTLHVEVVLVLADPVGLVQIARLEPAFENERIVVLVLQLVVRCQLGVVSVLRASALAFIDPMHLVDVRT